MRPGRHGQSPVTCGALGEHRLLCGDATRSEDVERLLGGTKAAMAFTDPPYNVSLGDHGGQQRGARKRRIANDSMDAISWEIFVRAWSRPFLASVDGRDLLLHEFPRSCRWSRESWPRKAATGPTTLIWRKDSLRPRPSRLPRHTSRSGSAGAKEPLITGVVTEIRTTCGRSTDLATPPLHPTMKPLPLMERAIGNSSVSGDLVLDLFAGSGSTMNRLRPEWPAVRQLSNSIPGMPT